ncbi:hypothetical protein WEN_02910 [Mycoplasma wenyonii str. Massachusetts]|uniref:Uncharacterized protein n=1 Tax=Mycoplasma wenyonii (strain Massachusetts) TaxID=1197325 RepID=I6ZJJ1_MYCWM|nr:hypothetical protein [Mycoplasma wenyonii]AFN65365.1 hypothetical protein WEN_02910 [Mycoplasma wenyonii str. Massachusetts]
MSLLVRTAQIFTVFGVGATIPLSTTFTKGRLHKINFLRHAGNGEQVIQEKVANTPMSQALQQLNEDEGNQGEVKWGCFWIPDFTGIVELFFCFNRNKPETPTLFHWKSKEKVLRKVQSIIRPTAFQFKDGITQQPMHRQLRSLLSWTQKWSREVPFDPSSHCRIARQNGKDYKLTCTNPNPDSTSTNNSPWEKTILNSYVVDPSVNL